MKKIKVLLVFSCLVSFAQVHAQPGVHGPKTISAANTVVNEYTYLTADASAGSTSLTVNNNTLNANSRFSGPLTQGDLVMIIQMQGANLNLTLASPFSLPNDNSWGTITAYNNAGNYEFAQVVSVAGTTTINILCGLKNDYTAAGHVQVVRVPRYSTLTINSSLTGDAWNGNTGGLVSVEVNGNTTIGASGSINVSGIGFRGGVETDNTAYYGAGSWGSSDVGEGAPKGEGIAGYTTEYTPLNARYARGAPANGGGGGNAHNCGGGGGGNAGNLATYTGYGVPNPAYNTIWNFESPAIGGTSSSGGGRGGNSFSNNNQNAASVAEADPSWGGDYNRNYGGQGGRPLDYSTGRLFFAGGGGSGEENDGDAGVGGNGAGLVFIMSYGNVSGSGVINANGQNGASSVYLAFSTFQAKDGAGGGGAGGTVVINTNGTVSGITINANGGNGGDQHFGAIAGSDAYGPGGGGGGGYIAVSAGSPTRTATGGTNGTTNSTSFSEFPPKGATSGGAGLPTEVFPHYHFTVANDTICSGNTATLSASVTGTVPSGVTLNWYASQFATTSLGSGTSFTTPVLTTTTTYYVGFCPGYYRLPVTVVVNPGITINTASMVINNETCAGSDGSISGITVSGSGTLTYTWNGVASAGPNLTGAGAGTYTLVVSSSGGCSATAGPFTIGSSGGPVINTASMVINNTTCGNANGSISGITVSGGTGTLSYTWNGTTYPSTALSSVTAGTYTLQVTDATGCSSSAGPFTISNTGGVVLNASSVTVNDATCGASNGSITGITASSSAGGLTYVWNGTIVTTPTANLTGQPAGAYTLVVTDAAGCSVTSATYNINDVGSPAINVSALNVTPTTCGLNNGAITGITVSGGTGSLSYQWNGTPAAGPTLSGAASGSYTLQVTDAGGCSSTAGPFTINPSNTLTASATGTNATCFGSNDGSASGSFSGGNGGITYQWIGGPATQNYTMLAPGTYSVIVSDVQACSDTATVTITSPPSIAPSITGTSAICSGQSTTLTASGTGATSFTWSPGGAGTSSITVSPTATTVYTVNVSNGSCSEVDSLTVTVNSAPVAGITGTTVVCPGQSTTLTANGGGTYAWSDGSTGTSITVSPTSNTQYYVVASNTCGSDTATVNITMGTSFTVDAGPDQTIGLGNSATIVVSGGTSYVWTPPSGLNCTTCGTVTASPSQTTVYTVTATNASGCTATDQVVIIVDETVSLFVPDIFAPNGNGVNDVLYVRGSGISNLTFRVYDRWGQKVFQTTDISQGWDGTFNGRPLDNAVFVYTLEGTYVTGESFSMKGNVTLKR